MTELLRSIAELNDAQTAAFETRGHCVVEAPPGSGKTKLLVTKMASDLENEVRPPHGVACITLTNAAAIEVHERFNALSSDSRANLFIGTVHAFALNQIVRPFAQLMNAGSLASVKVLSRSESDLVWGSVLDEQDVYDTNERRLFMTTIARYRSLMLPASIWDKVDQKLRDVYAAYNAELESMGRVDFTNIIERAVGFVERSSVVRNALRAAYPRIFVDEYQDLAPGLDRIVRALCFGSEATQSTLFAVGDADQAIYGWTGTNSRLLGEVAALPGVTRVALELNYRSGQRIVDVSRRLYEGGTVPSAAHTGGDIVVVKVGGSIAGQADFAADRTLELVASGTSLHEVAVFCRTNAMADEVSARLEAKGVPSWVKISEDWESPLSLLLERACAWVSYGREASGHSLGSLLREAGRTLPGISEESLGAVAARLMAAKGSDSAADLILAVRRQLEEGAGPDLLTHLENELDHYCDELASGSLSGLSILQLGGRRITEARVYVTTLAACKGLEFDHVFIVDLEDGRLPFFMTFDDQEQLEEERNKFYVGITRARLGVTLLWSGYTQTRFGNRESTLSRFVGDLDLET